MKDTGVNVTPSHPDGGAGDRWVRGSFTSFSADDTPSAPSPSKGSPTAPPAAALSGGGCEFRSRQVKSIATELAVVAHNTYMDLHPSVLADRVLEVREVLGDDGDTWGRVVLQLAWLCGRLAEAPPELGRLTILSTSTNGEIS